MSTIQGLRGFADHFGPDLRRWQHVEEQLKNLAQQYAYEPIRMPYLEDSALFQRAVGSTSDIVHKEMYSFIDKNNHSVSLRPEGTASCVRMCIEHNLLYGSRQKLYYQAPMFRRERPQKGRFRQFHQFGIEAFGYPETFIECEQIVLLEHIWQVLAIPKPVLRCNYLGSQESRARYRSALQAFYQPHLALFDELNRARLETNPLRILDAKEPAIVALNQNAPAMVDYLTDAEQNTYSDIRSQLNQLGISSTHDPSMVRGLDYYSGFIYEYTSDHLGAQSSVCGGGRYDQLFAQLGSESVSACGFSIGMERLISLMDFNKHSLSTPLRLHWLSLSDQAASQSINFSEQIRQSCPAVMVYTFPGYAKASNLLKKSEKMNADFAILCGDDELQQGTFICKNLRTREQHQCDMTQLCAILNREDNS